MWRDARLVAAKDLAIEARTRVGVTQIAPFAVLVLLLFAFAFDADRGALRDATPGLFWVTVLLSGLLAVQRAFALEAPDGLRDALRLSGLDPAGVYLGKVAAVVVQLVALEVLLAVGVTVLYDADLGAVAVVVPTAVFGAVAVAAVGCAYGVLSVGHRVGTTLLPLLVLPALAPLLLCATLAFSRGLDGASGEAWRWFALVAAFAASYVALGLVTFRVLLEDA